MNRYLLIALFLTFFIFSSNSYAHIEGEDVDLLPFKPTEKVNPFLITSMNFGVEFNLDQLLDTGKFYFPGNSQISDKYLEDYIMKMCKKRLQAGEDSPFFLNFNLALNVPINKYFSIAIKKITNLEIPITYKHNSEDNLITKFTHAQIFFTSKLLPIYQSLKQDPGLLSFIDEVNDNKSLNKILEFINEVNAPSSPVKNVLDMSFSDLYEDSKQSVSKYGIDYKSNINSLISSIPNSLISSIPNLKLLKPINLSNINTSSNIKDLLASIHNELNHTQWPFVSIFLKSCTIMDFITTINNSIITDAKPQSSKKLDKTFFTTTFENTIKDYWDKTKFKALIQDAYLAKTTQKKLYQLILIHTLLKYSHPRDLGLNWSSSFDIPVKFTCPISLGLAGDIAPFLSLDCGIKIVPNIIAESFREGFPVNKNRLSELLSFGNKEFLNDHDIILHLKPWIGLQYYPIEWVGISIGYCFYTYQMSLNSAYKNSVQQIFNYLDTDLPKDFKDEFYDFNFRDYTHTFTFDININF